MTEAAAGYPAEHANPIESWMAAWAAAVQQLRAQWSLTQLSTSEVVESSRSAAGRDTEMSEATLKWRCQLSEVDAFNEDVVLTRLAEATAHASPWSAAMRVFSGR
jgi:hypothetical protein